MSSIIEWCNSNTGFLTAVLSFVGLIISTTAVIVSIKTARLPYKKKILLSASAYIEFYGDLKTGQSGKNIIGISVNATNTGTRDINITYLGFLVKDKPLQRRKNKLGKIRDEVTGTGIISCAEVKTENYKKEDIIYALKNLGKHARVSLYACDSEGHEYTKRMGHVSKLLRSLS